MIKNKEIVERELKKREKTRRLTKDVVAIVESFFESIDYKTDAMTFDKYAKFVKENGFPFRQAFMAFTVIRSILFYEFYIDWKFDLVYELFDACDLSKEAAFFATKDEWDEFLATGISELSNMPYGAYDDYFFVLVLTARGVTPHELRTIRKKDINEAGFVYIQERDFDLPIDKNAVALIQTHLNKLAPDDVVYSRRPAMRESFKSVNAFSLRIANMRASDLYMSGLLYRLSQGEQDVEFNNAVLNKYYHKIAVIIYG